MLLSSPNSRFADFVLIDLGGAIIGKDTPDTVWKKACKEDILDLQEVFEDARPVEAVMLGCQLIQDTTSTPQPLTASDGEISNQVSDNFQAQLSHLLSSAQSGKTITFLTDKILSTIKHLIPQLARLADTEPPTANRLSRKGLGNIPQRG